MGTTGAGSFQHHLVMPMVDLAVEHLLERINDATTPRDRAVQVIAQLVVNPELGFAAAAVALRQDTCGLALLLSDLDFGAGSAERLIRLPDLQQQVNLFFVE
jgi:hypothetical protein